ncbi:MAG: hypothetical protein AAB553_06955 [Patescibacteria group bacterium]
MPRAEQPPQPSRVQSEPETEASSAVTDPRRRRGVDRRRLFLGVAAVGILSSAAYSETGPDGPDGPETPSEIIDQLGREIRIIAQFKPFAVTTVAEQQQNPIWKTLNSIIPPNSELSPDQALDPLDPKMVISMYAVTAAATNASAVGLFTGEDRVNEKPWGIVHLQRLPDPTTDADAAAPPIRIRALFPLTRAGSPTESPTGSTTTTTTTTEPGSPTAASSPSITDVQWIFAEWKVTDTAPIATVSLATGDDYRRLKGAMQGVLSSHKAEEE